MKNFITFTAAFLLTAVLSGCVATISGPMPVPPPAEVEVVGVAPFVGAVWMPGYWEWYPRHHRHYWRHGYWRR